MSIQQYEQAKKLIKEVGGGDFEGPKPEILVAKTEEVLGIIFPPSYRRFLLEIGCGDINGFEIYGLIDDNFEKSTVPNGIWLTQHLRRTIHLDPSYVVIGDGGDGTYYALDLKQIDRTGETPVVRLAVDGKSGERIAGSFDEYVLDGVSDRLV